MGGGGNRHCIAGRERQNDPLLTASKKEETVAMAKLDGVGVEKDQVVPDDRDRRGGDRRPYKKEGGGGEERGKERSGEVNRRGGER